MKNKIWKKECYSLSSVPYVVDEDDNFIAKVYCNTAIGKKEALKNASLLAAAPEMLNALEAIKETCPADSDTTNRFWEAWQKLESAIKKAKGE